MEKQQFKRLPNHIGIIPDGNRRWAVSNGMNKQEGYGYGIDPGFELYSLCLEQGIKELTFYGFTQDNTKRPSIQTEAFTRACVHAVEKLAHRDADLLVIGNTDSPLFPKELLPYTNRVTFGKGLIKINFLVNYGWNWDLNHVHQHREIDGSNFNSKIASSDISRIDLIIRWGGGAIASVAFCRFNPYMPIFLCWMTCGLISVRSIFTTLFPGTRPRM
jgi:undecaprenyl diphosphate synthase